MITGEVLYLLMCAAMFVSFAATLAYQSWAPAKLTAAKQPTVAAPAASIHALNA